MYIPGAPWDEVDFGLTSSMSRYSSSFSGGSPAGVSENRFELNVEFGVDTPRFAPAGRGTS